jgi:predicted regulator of Ras-like GTPase activity (Roadblock/LC7/MglB family)
MILNELMDAVPGATGAILADWEGEAVEQCCCYDVYDLKVIGAHKGILLNIMKDVHRKLAVGEIRHTVISTDRHHFITGPIGPDYLLVMTLDKGAIVGLAVRCFESALERMYKEIY